MAEVIHEDQREPAQWTAFPARPDRPDHPVALSLLDLAFPERVAPGEPIGQGGGHLVAKRTLRGNRAKQVAWARSGLSVRARYPRDAGEFDAFLGQGFGLI